MLDKEFQIFKFGNKLTLNTNTIDNLLIIYNSH